MALRMWWTRRALRWGERGQTTVEYALVILAAAAIAGLVIAWATGSGAIGRLFDGALARVEQMAQ
jgi:Flp pilus assembly pilin Flp